MIATITKAMEEFLSTQQLTSIEWVRPPKWEMGQIGFPVFRYAKERKCNPTDLAQDISRQLTQHSLPKEIERIEAFGPYVNVFLNWKVIAESMLSQARHGVLCAQTPQRDIPPILVEYSSPNLAKPLGVHHLRGTIIGQVLANLYAFGGYPVIRYNYLGDMGTAFGKLCVGAFKCFGPGWKEHPYTIDELYRAYVCFQDLETDPDAKIQVASYTHALEKKEPHILPFHAHVFETTQSAFSQTYAKLGVHFDVWDGEFRYADHISELLQWLDTVPGVHLKPSEGAKVLSFDDATLSSLILIKSDGASVYLARDILSARHRISHYHPEKLIYVVGAEQTLHLKQLTYVLTQAGLTSNKEGRIELVHMPYGLMRFKGMKMATRKGTVVLLEDVIAQATEEMKERMGKKEKMDNIDLAAERVGIGALVFSQLLGSASHSIEFNWADIFNVEGDTGPYIFYAYARLSGILRKLNIDRVTLPDHIVWPSSHTIIDQLLYEILRFPQMVNTGLADPSIFARYVLELAKSSNAFYHAYTIKDEPDPDVQASLLAVLQMAQSALHRGATLLNMQLLEIL